MQPGGRAPYKNPAAPPICVVNAARRRSSRRPGRARFWPTPRPAMRQKRLTAAFTAQLLGQILPDPERRSAPGYGGAQPPIALIFDTQL
jgi:hypothetical protein